VTPVVGFLGDLSEIELKPNPDEVRRRAQPLSSLCGGTGYERDPFMQLPPHDVGSFMLCRTKSYQLPICP
jgi:hypothetical protein